MIMTNKHFFTLLLFAICSVSNAQNIKVAGKVINNNNSDEVIAATISLLSDSSLVKGVITSITGDFELDVSKRETPYNLRVTHMEFDDSYHTIIPDKDTTIIIKLSEKTVSLGEVEVVAKKRLYEFQNDKLIVNINSVPNIETYDLSKLLLILPGVINQGGSLTLNGKNAVIYMNGKKQRIDMSALPVDVIEKIELIYSSGGIHDASDEAIINVVLKKMKIDGYYLSLGGNGGGYDGLHFDGGGSSTFMFKKKNILLNSSLSYRNNYNYSHINETLQYSDHSRMLQNRKTNGRTNVYMGMVNLNWDIKEGHNLYFNVFFNESFANKTSNQKYVYQQDVTDRNNWHVKSKGRDDMWSGHVEYASPDSLNKKIKTSYTVLYGDINNHQHTDEDGEKILYTDDDILAYRHILKLDYEHTFSPKTMLALGIKADWGRLHDDITYIESINSNRYPNNRFSGNEDIYAAYIQLKQSINDNWSANVSLRSELTNYRYNYKTQNETATDSYANLFPFFSLGYKSKNNNYQMSLSISSSIQRPEYENMLPGIRYSNQYNYIKGNPHIKPTIRRSLMIRGMLYQYINLFATYELCKDMRGYVITNSEIDPLITEYQYNNIADFDRFYFGGSVDYKMTKLSGQMGMQAHYARYKNAKNGFVFHFDRNGFWKSIAYLVSNYQITKRLGMRYICQYSFKDTNPMIITHSSWLMNLGVHYNSPNDKWSLSFNANDMLHPKKHKELFFGNNYINQYNLTNSRSLQLSFIVKFRGGEKVENKAKAIEMESNRFSKKN